MQNMRYLREFALVSLTEMDAAFISVVPRCDSLPPAPTSHKYCLPFTYKLKTPTVYSCNSKLLSYSPTQLSCNSQMYSTSSKEPEYTTVWSAPPKKPSGRTKYIETRHPVYRGVRRRGTLNRWVCEVRNPNNKSRIWLGTFQTAEMAARAHDVAVMALRDRSGCLNFADSAWLIKIPPSFSSVQEMKQVAVEVAEALHSRNSSYLAKNVSVTTSWVEMVDKKDVALSLMAESTINSVAYDQMEFNWDGNGEINLGLYYASLAEDLMMEPPIEWFSNLDDDNELGGAVSLWN